MPRPRFYYGLKPFVPWRLRLALRRLSVRQSRRKWESVWPIDPASAKVPAGWPGWPDSKNFAFVITHDVEDQHGVDKCRQLAEVEMEMGFRSSFNFIPEGPYLVPVELRTWLTDEGFEVGVHDLRHDGKLYASRSKFRENAQRINFHLKEWGAKGFRSGFMLHELDWIHDLDILYDSSTFDTDPFEPQPDAAGTIFPFWVPGSGMNGPAGEPPSSRARGYLEIPYTLPQDSTLFSVFREKTPEIWLRKLDWIAGRGGMALINVHPDYVGFNPGRTVKREFPVDHYKSLLRYIKVHYFEKYWNPLPVDLARWYVKEVQSKVVDEQPARKQRLPNLAGKRAAVLLYSYYPSDSRPRRAAEAMVEAGMEVDLLCLKEGPSEPDREKIHGVNVFRTPIRRIRGRRFSYVLKYGLFFLTSLWWLFKRGFRGKYDVVHVHNMPDFLVFAAAFQKMSGTRIILDLHDPMPELMRSIYGLRQDNWQIRLLLRLESMAIKFSSVALTPNITFKNLFASRSCAPEKMRIIMNSPEEEIFDPAIGRTEASIAPSQGSEFRIMHHGSIVRRHGVDVLVRAVAKVRTNAPGIHLDIYGRREPFLDEVMKLAANLGIADVVHYHGVKSPTEIGKAIERTHLGVIPNRRSSFTELNFPTRIFEYLAMGRPVVAPASQGITDYFGPTELILFEQDNIDDLAAKILWVHDNPDLVRETVGRGVRVYRQHLWQEEKKSFLYCVDDIIGPVPKGSHFEQYS
jgi:glycosyltransferase involved in cell wall biosynthesis